MRHNTPTVERAHVLPSAQPDRKQPLQNELMMMVMMARWPACHDVCPSNHDRAWARGASAEHAMRVIAAAGIHECKRAIMRAASAGGGLMQILQRSNMPPHSCINHPHSFHHIQRLSWRIQITAYSTSLSDNQTANHILLRMAQRPLERAASS